MRIMPMEYRKKPVTIEAIQFTDSDERVQELIEFTQGNFTPHRDLEHYAYAVIKTLEGDHRADIGDYIIKGVQGEFYPCKPDIFDMTYEAVEEEGGKRATEQESRIEWYKKGYADGIKDAENDRWIFG